MLFGRAFENAFAALFRGDDSAAVLSRDWSMYRDQDLQHSNGDSWNRMHQRVQLLDRFCQDGRARVHQPQRNLQVEFKRPIPRKDNFVAYIDAIGQLDGSRCLLEWKTSCRRYPVEPTGLLALDPQLICYSWNTWVS